MRWHPNLRRSWRRLRATSARTGLILLCSVIVLLGILGGGLSKLEVKTGVDSFMPPDDPTTHATNEVASSFGGDPIVVTMESQQPGGLLSGPQLPRLLNLEGKLARLPDTASVYGPASVLNQVAGQSQKLLAELTGYRDGLRGQAENAARSQGASASQVRRAGERATVDFDRRYGSLLAQGLPGGLPTLHNERFVQNVVFNEAGAPRPQWHFVVPRSDTVAVLVRPRENLSQEATERLVGSVRQSVEGAGLDTQRNTVAGVPTIVSALGNQLRHEVPLLGGVALLAVGAWFLLMRWIGWRRRLVPLLTTLLSTGLTLATFGWLDWPISLGTVAILPILLGVGSDFMTYLYRRVGRRVVASVGLATGASFGALTAIPIPAVRELGITLAVGISFALAVAMLVAWWFPPATAQRDEQYSLPASATTGSNTMMSRRGRIVFGAVVGLLGMGGWVLLSALPLKTDFQSFAEDLPVLQDSQHVEKVIGSSGEIDIALSGQDTVTKESLEWMRQAQSKVIAAHGDQVRPTISPPTLLEFLGQSPTPDQLESALRLLPKYLSGSVIQDDQKMSVMSFGVKPKDATQLQSLRDDITRILPPPPPGLQVRLTGLPMVAVSGHELVSTGRYLANALGIAAAGTVLALGLRRRSDAIRALAAATLATGLGLLGMWLCGIALTPITVAVGSLTAAVGCEFTVVLAESVRRQDRGIRKAVVLAAAASATGYSVLTLSALSLIQQFGALLVSTVGLAFLCAAFVVWLTTGPVGKRTTPISTSTEEDLVGAT